jgi:hypothetical protein
MSGRNRDCKGHIHRLAQKMQDTYCRTAYVTGVCKMLAMRIPRNIRKSIDEKRTTLGKESSSSPEYQLRTYKNEKTNWISFIL